MVVLLVAVIVLGLGVAVWEIAAARRAARRSTRAQLDALRRVVDPDRPADGGPENP